MGRNNKFEPYTVGWIIDIGEWIGRTIFDAHRGESCGKDIFLQREHYAEMIGKGFYAYIIVMVFPIIYKVNLILLDWVLQPFSDAFLVSLLGVPPLSYGLYGVGAALTGTLYSSINIFDNFLTEGIKKGQKLALAHVGIFYALIGGVFQSINSINSDIPPPADMMPAMVDTIYMALDNIEYATPYLVSGFALCTVVIVCYYEIQNKETYQTTLYRERL